MGKIKPIASALRNYEYEIKDRDDNGFVLLQSGSTINYF